MQQLPGKPILDVAQQGGVADEGEPMQGPVNDEFSVEGNGINFKIRHFLPLLQLPQHSYFSTRNRRGHVSRTFLARKSPDAATCRITNGIISESNHPMCFFV
jgi:hypothetical protein